MTERSRMAQALAQTQIVGIAWYLKEDYPAVLRIMADADAMPVSFEKWLYKIHKTERDIKAMGKIVMRAVIDPATFPAWCAARNLNVDTQARQAFASEYAYRHGRN